MSGRTWDRQVDDCAILPEQAQFCNPYLFFLSRCQWAVILSRRFTIFQESSLLAIIILQVYSAERCTSPLHNSPQDKLRRLCSRIPDSLPRLPLYPGAVSHVILLIVRLKSVHNFASACVPESYQPSVFKVQLGKCAVYLVARKPALGKCSRYIFNRHIGWI